MRKHKLPFRVGHHFASEVVDYAKANNIKPLDFPYGEAKRIYAGAVKGTAYAGELPMTEAQFRSLLDPVAIVRNRATVGGPQPAEMERMLKASRERLARQGDWVKEKRARISGALERLDGDFGKLVSRP
jgi:argininosuccinate lyase